MASGESEWWDEDDFVESFETTKYRNPDVIFTVPASRKFSVQMFYYTETLYYLSNTQINRFSGFQ